MGLLTEAQWRLFNEKRLSIETEFAFLKQAMLSSKELQALALEDSGYSSVGRMTAADLLRRPSTRYEAIEPFLQRG